MTSNLDTSFYKENPSRVPNHHIIYMPTDTSTKTGGWLKRSYKVITGKLHDFWNWQDMDKQTDFVGWLTSEEAKKYGLIDSTSSLFDATSSAARMMAKHIK